MSVFSRGERVRIVDSKKEYDRVYRIKDMKKTKDGGVLYLLRSLEEDPVLRLYYEDKESLLERIC
ncbi:MAG: hypothetical protein EPO62_02375 [Candidatus Nitrosotenuis sp.]|nr:MAG: hypothetical protein EPO62_02375 [Candidatus Nitrosotenuis sp.]